MSFIQALTLTPLRHRILAFMAGLILPLSYAPFHILPLFYVSFICLFYLAWGARDNRRHLLWLGWLFGCGQFLVGFYWLGESFIVLGGGYLWLMPLALAGLVAGLALFPALALFIWGLLRPYVLRFNKGGQASKTDSHLDGHRFYDMLLLALIWSLGEYARANVLTGLPWNLAGMVWAGFLPLAQMASVLGLFGMGLLCVISAACLSVPDKKIWAAGLSLPLMALGLGLVILQEETHPLETAPKILVIQPNIKQADKWLPEKRAVHIETIFTLIKQGLAEHKDSDIIVLPETAIPFLIDEDDAFARLLRRHLPQDKYLLLGAVRRSLSPKNPDLKNPDSKNPHKDYDYYNSAMLWSSNGTLLAQIDKYHLVPFGEYLPAQGFLEAIGLRQLTQLRGGFATRNSASIEEITLKDIPPFMPLICFEATFPYLAAANGGAKWLVNLTNDAWFGTSTGPAQHLAHTKLRAIEQGLPLIRSANTGISAVFDAYGRRLKMLPLNQKGYFSVLLPNSRSFTIYSYSSDILYLIIIFMVSIFIARKGLAAYAKKILRKV
ncbi:MAG: apolipoprotein N-acyltransferase [Alphaproteobacteria bacterium]|nr:apolipoprotein N-acyltransferase [Alphaproteobacteria bacterium]